MDASSVATSLGVDSRRTSTYTNKPLATTVSGQGATTAPATGGMNVADRPAVFRPSESYADEVRYDAGTARTDLSGLAVPYYPYRPLFIAARWANVVLALMLFALSFVAQRQINRANWMNPILTPSLTAMCNSLFDLYRVHFQGRRGCAGPRFVYDGVLLGTGLAIAGGFLASFAVPDFQRTAPDATAESAGVAGAILFGMFGMMLIQYGLGLNGLHQIIQLRRGKYLRHSENWAIKTATGYGQRVAQIAASLQKANMANGQPRLPRGFRNPGHLCYRNAIVVALLNGDRFVSFLYDYVARLHPYIHQPDVAHLLLKRLYHLDVAYWQPPAVRKVHGSTYCACDEDTLETMQALFWTACKYDMDETTVLKSMTRRSTATQRCKSWATLCQEQHHRLCGGELSRLQPFHLCEEEQQQDAVDFFNWLLDMAKMRLAATPFDRRCRAAMAKAADRFDALFRLRLAPRYVCTTCRRAFRLQRCAAEQCTSLKVKIKDRPRPDHRIQPLCGYLQKLFNESTIAHGTSARCEHCKGQSGHTAATLTRVLRLQAVPAILSIHLLRVNHDADGQAAVKLQTVVDCPEYLDVSRWLDLQAFESGSSTRVVYRLSSVVSHRGVDASSGHYVAHVRHGEEQPAEAPHSSSVEAAVHAARQAAAKSRLFDAMLDRAEAAHRAAAFAENICTIEEQEDESNGCDWARIDDETATTGIPFREITNTFRDPAYGADSPDWYDPVLLVYEKWVDTSAAGAAE